MKNRRLKWVTERLQGGAALAEGVCKNQPLFMSTYRSRSLGKIALVLGIAAVSLMVAQAASSPLTNDFSLRNAIAAAAPGATILVGGDITLTNGELVLDKDLSIVGTGPTSNSISGAGLSRVFRITGGNVSLKCFSVVNGNAASVTPSYGGAILNYGQLIMSNCYVLNNHTESLTPTDEYGGGLYNGGSLLVQNCLFSNNICSSSGGGILNAGTAVVQGGQFVANVSHAGGGGIQNLGTLSVTNSGFTNNHAFAEGGAGLGNRAGATATLENCDFISNTAEYLGGGGIINYGTLYVTNCTLSANAVANDSSDPNISGGGGLYNAGTAFVYQSEIGSAAFSGGNSARRGGGVLNVGPGGAATKLVMERSSIIDNRASRLGGGLLNQAVGSSATACLTNVTIANNKVTGLYVTAAGIDNSASVGAARVDVASCTIAFNSITNISGNGAASGLFSGNFGGSSSANVNVLNSIVDQNSGTMAAPQANGNITSRGHNLCSDAAGPLSGATDIRGASRLLSYALKPYGRVYAYQLDPASPAVDGGDPDSFPPTDARGVSRPFGPRADIGAFENLMNLFEAQLQPGQTNFYVYYNPYRTGAVIQLTYQYILFSKTYTSTHTFPNTNAYFDPFNFGSYFDVDTNFFIIPCSSTNVQFTLTAFGTTWTIRTNANTSLNPTIIAPTDVTVPTDPCQSYARGVSLGTPTASDYCGETLIVWSNAPAQFPVGTNIVEWAAVNEGGKASTTTQKVIVIAYNPTIIVCRGNIVTNADPELAPTIYRCSTIVSDYGPVIATNQCGESFPVDCDPPAGPLAVFSKGTTTVTCTAQDGSTNLAQCSFTVTVLDMAPSLTCPTNIIAQSTGTSAVATWNPFITRDDCDGDLAVVCTPPSGSTFPNGTNTVTCSATDSSSNTGTCSFKVIVEGGVPQPRLSIVTSGTNVIVTWAKSADVFTLQYTDSLGVTPGANWQSHTGTITETTTNYSATITATGNQFLRLYKP